jgi:hypothetical protein
MQDRTKQTTLAGFFGKPKAGAAPSRPNSALAKVPPTSSSQPATTLKGNSSSQVIPGSQSPASSSNLKTPSSTVESPHTLTEKERKRAGSPLKQSITVDDVEDGSLSPPPADVEMEEVKESVDESMDVDTGGGRRAKRKVVYAESGGSDSEDDVPLQRAGNGESSLCHY